MQDGLGQGRAGRGGAGQGRAGQGRAGRGGVGLGVRGRGWRSGAVRCGPTAAHSFVWTGAGRIECRAPPRRAQATYYTAKIVQCFFLKKYADAVKYIERCHAVDGSIECSHTWYVYHIFAALALASATRYSVKSQRDYLVSLCKRHNDHVRRFSDDYPENFEHMKTLCLTHYRWADGDGLATLKDYEVAATGAKLRAHSHFAGIALECAGQVAEDYENSLMAVGYYQCVRGCWQGWA